jgi:aminopeptidase YwaD
MKYQRFSFLILFSVVIQVQAQKLKKSDRPMAASLKSHINYLSDDKLEGRRAGTNGEQLAAAYISKQFETIGLKPAGDDGKWVQSFLISKEKKVLPSTHLLVNGHDLKLNKEFFPFAFSGNGRLEAAVAIALAERGVPWFFDVKEAVDENQENPHFNLLEYLEKKAAKSKDNGATALIIYNSSDSADGLVFDGKSAVTSAGIPVLYVTREARKKYLADESSTLDITLRVDITETERKGMNVVGFIDNGAPQTIVLGAHYDHIGLGEDGNSLSRSGTKQIHNGADDNASGTAGIIELARMLKQSGKKENNYLVAAFSGEELGLHGSKHLANNSPVALTSVNYMINLDMVGRLNESTKTITVGGVGTSDTWGTIVPAVAKNRYFKLKIDSSGSGPSDHTSFYRKNIPVLYFFTGLHTDYHRPDDDADKINYAGEVAIIRYIFDLIQRSAGMGKLAFTPTRESPLLAPARFTVTLGIMPDYTFSGPGVKVDGISDGRPAQKAGIQAGDVIVKLGDISTTTLNSYMEALSKYKKGEKATVIYRRGAEEKSSEVEF